MQESMSECKVTLESKLTIVSSRTAVNSGKTQKLSGVDHAMGYHTLHLIFYYKNEQKWFTSFGLDPLRESLAEVLSIYPTITGRLGREKDEDGGDWEVRCNDTGVRAIKANVDCTIDEWLSSASGSDETQLIAWDHMPNDPSTWSPFRIQINSFKEGGVAIGLSCSHMVSDLTFASSFFKSWSQTHCNYPISHPPFFTPTIPNSSLPNNINIIPDSSSKPQTVVTSSTNNVVTATFKFSSSIIKQCLSKIQNTTCSNATPFDFLSALFWTRVTHLKPSKVDNQNHSLSICRDFRKLIKPSLPIGYFGNALHFSNLSIKVQDMENGQLEDIANVIHKHLKGVTEEEIRSSIESFETRKESMPKCMYGSELTCVCMEEEETSSLLYESMFSNDEKPAHVSCRIGNVDGEGLIMVLPSSEGGFARTVIVMLQEKELSKLCNDEEILKLEPTIILADCRVQL